MIQSAKNEVFGHFLEFGLLDRLDIAYFDGTKCFLLLNLCSNGIVSHWRGEMLVLNFCSNGIIFY